ncbi:MAG: hypothetical protein WCK58_13370 [Chloroflexota bacterium]
MADDPNPFEIAAAWRPQLPGKLAVKHVKDALVEPEWVGARVAAALTTDEAALFREGDRIRVPSDLAAALIDAFNAVDAVVEGRLTTKALEDGAGVAPALPSVERPPILIPRVFRSGVKDDPFVRSRDREHRAATLEPRVIDAVERGERHAFVATDLLWLDGTPLDDVPLAERKRLLDGVIIPSVLVRVTPYIKPSAKLTLVTWGQLGFEELAYRAANSRYTAGAENPDYAMGMPPMGPQGPSRGPVSKR